MSDDVIPLEEALRRRLARQTQEEEERRSREQREQGGGHGVRLSDAMTHLLDDEAAEKEGPSAAELRRIVECELIEERDDCFGRQEEQPDEAE